jgi:hypothetical protein
VADYPFPGCCEHTPNAHSRKHCLLCECEKGPVQVGQPAQDPQPGVLELSKCGTCRALLENEEDRTAHLDWHERQLRTIENLALAVSGLRHRTTDPKESTDD